MNKTFKKINIEDCIFYDVESTSANGQLDLNSKEFELWQWKNRDKVTGEFLTDVELQDLYQKIAALKIGYNKIVTIGVGFVRDGEVRIKSLSGTEEDIIRQFCRIANNFKYAVSFNGISFDSPLIINNGNKYFDISSELKDEFNTSQKKEWGVPFLIDLMLVLRGSHYNNISFDEACYMYGVESPKDDIKGSEVTKTYYSGGIDRIRTYVKKDVFALVQLFRALRHEDKFEDFVDVDGQKAEEATPQPILKKLFNTKQLTNENKEELKNIFSKNKLTKKDKEIAFNIVKASLSEIDINFGKVSNAKEIDEVINQLKNEL